MHQFQRNGNTEMTVKPDFLHSLHVLPTSPTKPQRIFIIICPTQYQLPLAKVQLGRNIRSATRKKLPNGNKYTLSLSESAQYKVRKMTIF